MPTTSCCSALLPASRGMRGGGTRTISVGASPYWHRPTVSSCLRVTTARPASTRRRRRETVPDASRSSLGLDRQYGRHRPRAWRVQRPLAPSEGLRAGRGGASRAPRRTHWPPRQLRLFGTTAPALPAHGGAGLVPQRRPARPVYQRLDRSLHDAGDSGREGEAGDPAHRQVARLNDGALGRLEPNDRCHARSAAANEAGRPAMSPAPLPSRRSASPARSDSLLA